MSVQVENLEKNMAKLTIEVSAEDLEKALESAYQKQKKQISVPGFRKGKVPRAMIEKMYGVDVFYEDAANALMQQNYAAAVDESGIDIVSRPTVDVVQIEKGKPFIFTAEVAVKPEVTLGKYMGVTVTKIDTSVSDEEVDEALEKERNNNARTINVTDRPVAQGDTAVIDFEGFVDGVAFDGMFLARLLQGNTLLESVQASHAFVCACIRESEKYDYPEREGLLIEKTLRKIV